MNENIVISCEQCRKLIRIPSNRGSMSVKCPHCQAIFTTPDLTIAKEKCLNSDNERQQEDESTFISTTEFPRWNAAYEKFDKILKEFELEDERERAPDDIITKKKCPNCGWERYPDDAAIESVPPTQCPICYTVYQEAENLQKKQNLQGEQKRTREMIRREEEQKQRAREKEREAARREAEQISRRHHQRNAAEMESQKGFLSESEEHHRQLEASEKAKFAEHFNPKAKLGFLTKMAVKTAVKKSLMDITDRLNLFPHSTMREKLKMFVTIAGMSNEIPSCEHWEGTFFLLVFGQTRGQLTSISNFVEYMPIIAELTADWINRVLDGKAENMYSEINRIPAIP